MRLERVGLLVIAAFVLIGRPASAQYLAAPALHRVTAPTAASPPLLEPVGAAGGSRVAGAAHGALVGAGVGAAVGLLVVVVQPHSDHSEDAVGPIIGAFFGLVIGAAIGAAHPR